MENVRSATVRPIRSNSILYEIEAGKTRNWAVMAGKDPKIVYGRPLGDGWRFGSNAAAAQGRTIQPAIVPDFHAIPLLSKPPDECDRGSLRPGELPALLRLFLRRGDARAHRRGSASGASFSRTISTATCLRRSRAILSPRALACARAPLRNRLPRLLRSSMPP